MVAELVAANVRTLFNERFYGIDFSIGLLYLYSTMHAKGSGPSLDSSTEKETLLFHQKLIHTR
jgi:hypothetical protein